MLDCWYLTESFFWVHKFAKLQRLVFLCLWICPMRLISGYINFELEDLYYYCQLYIKDWLSCLMFRSGLLFGNVSFNSYCHWHVWPHVKSAPSLQTCGIVDLVFIFPGRPVGPLGSVTEMGIGVRLCSCAGQMHTPWKMRSHVIIYKSFF